MNMRTEDHGNILIVDDKADNLAVLSELLEQSGFKVQPALFGELALRAVAARKPDLILLDICMPEMDGFEVCRALKADPLSRDIPVIFVSAMLDLADRTAAFAAGGVDYVSKPFFEEEILARVRTHIQLYRSTQQLKVLLSTRTAECDDNEARLRLAMSCADLATWDWNIETGHVVFSERWASMRGLRVEDINPHVSSWQNELFPDDTPSVMQALADHFAGNTPLYRVEYRIRNASGMRAWLMAQGSVIKRDPEGRPLRMLGIEMDISQRKNIEEALIKNNQDLADRERSLAQLSIFLQRVREEDRAHFARELHDDLGQNLTALRIDFNGLAAVLGENKSSLSVRLSAIDQLIDSTVDAVRRICEELRPGMLDDLGLEAALSSYCHRFSRQFGVACDLSLDREDYGLNEPISTAIFRIVQESLTNIARHARAAHALVSLEDRGDDLLLTIADDGCGLSAELSGERKTYGLLGMRERVSMLGGQMSIDSEPGRGTHIEVSIPRHQEGGL
ncbi:MAG: response regulator [Betaproteobacteria bacterium]